LKKFTEKYGLVNFENCEINFIYNIYPIEMAKTKEIIFKADIEDSIVLNISIPFTKENELEDIICSIFPEINQKNHKLDENIFNRKSSNIMNDKYL